MILNTNPGIPFSTFHLLNAEITPIIPATIPKNIATTYGNTIDNIPATSANTFKSFSNKSK